MIIHPEETAEALRLLRDAVPRSTPIGRAAVLDCLHRDGYRLVAVECRHGVAHLLVEHPDWGRCWTWSGRSGRPGQP